MFIEVLGEIIKYVYPVSFIGLVTTGVGYLLGTLVARRRRKPWEKMIEESHK